MKLKTGIILIFLVAITGVVYLASSQNSANRQEPKVLAQNSQENASQRVFLAISGANGETQNFEVNFFEGLTAFELLKNKMDNLGIILETMAYDAGIFIEKIGDSKNGDGGKYWLYYVNGEMPNVSADKKVLKVGDKVEFKFEKPSF